MADQDTMKRVYDLLNKNWMTPEHISQIKKHMNTSAPILKYFPIKESK